MYKTLSFPGKYPLSDAHLLYFVFLGNWLITSELSSVLFPLTMRLLYIVF